MSLTLAQLAAHAAKILHKHADVDQLTLAYAWPHAWHGADRIQIDSFELPVHFCASPLELREALAREHSAKRLLLTPLPENQLGQDVLGRLYRQRLLHVDRWQLVQDAFDVLQIDPRLERLEWMPDLLLANASHRRHSAATALTWDDALESCLVGILALNDQPLDLSTVLIACEQHALRWNALGHEVRQVFRQFLDARLGSLASVLLATSEAGNGHAVLGIGLACEVLYAPASDLSATPELRDARVRLEQRLNHRSLKEVDGRRWGELARQLVLQRAPAARVPVMRLAADLLQAIGAGAFIGMSSVLPEALDQRLDELAQALVRFLRSSQKLPEVETATNAVLAHRAPGEHPGHECARMVLRLCRREAMLEGAAVAVDPVSDYLEHGAWEDWARRMLRGARPESLAKAVTRLLDRVADRRLADDEAFARSVVRAAAIGEVPAHVLAIEQTLTTVLAPVAASQPVLMVVLDGMSQDVYLAISSGLAERGWSAWSRPDLPRALLATTPSVTECSRASLLSGRLQGGAAHVEKQAFAQHQPLKRVSREGKPPLLIHKANLEYSQQLGPDALAALADPDQRVVAVVINAIDDTLAKSEQVRIDWTLETIPLLAQVLEQARRTGRAVLLTSDHGHVLERQTVLRPDGEGERWRRAGRALEAGEISVSGPRVEALKGNALIVPWSERIRYAAKKNGYHGGLSRQEMLVPFGIWTTGQSPGAAAEAWQMTDRAAPDWWSATTDAGLLSRPKARSAGRKANAASAGMEDLFSMTPADDWLDRLMASPLLQRQRARPGNAVLEAERLRALLAQLQQHGGRRSMEQLGAAIGQPALRMRGMITVMCRVLNVDGLPVVRLELETQTVLLDAALLKAQFLT